MERRRDEEQHASRSTQESRRPWRTGYGRVDSLTPLTDAPMRLWGRGRWQLYIDTFLDGRSPIMQALDIKFEREGLEKGYLYPSLPGLRQNARSQSSLLSGADITCFPETYKTGRGFDHTAMRCRIGDGRKTQHGMSLDSCAI